MTFDIDNKEAPRMMNNIDKKRGVVSLISNFPKIDQFVQLCIGDGRITKTLMFDNKGNTDQPMIVYNIKNFNYCENISRSHKSNTIYYIADINRMCIFQKCHKCIGFRGKDIFLKDI